MTSHRTGTREEWRTARLQLLEAEKDLTRRSDALAEARGTTAVLDDGFSRDVEEGIAERSQPWNPPTWG